MRRASASIIGILGLLPAGLAVAGPFGGFSRDGSRYLVDQSRVCEPMAASRGAARCEKKSPDEVARLGFRKGAAQRGAGARVSAQVAGTRLVVRSADGGAPRAEWDSGSPIGSIGAVFLSDSGVLVAIEYDARLAGRSSTQVVVLPLSPDPASGNAGSAPPGGPGPGPAPASGATGPTAPPDDPKITAQIQAADGQLARKKWKKAEEEYRRILALGDHPAARYGLAAALAGQNRGPDAVAELTALAASTHPQAPRWLVEARLGPHFSRLQTDPAFRKAVGLERDPRRPPSTYERLVALGGHWEQTGTPCQEPTVDLRLDRKTEKFQLSIRNRCQGNDETTRLGGTWRAEGGALRLRFPNTSGPEEELQCPIDAAPDRSGEDAITCSLEELTFSMRVVRR